MKKWARAEYLPGLPLYGKTRVTASEEHIQLSKEAAKAGMVLLKNKDHILPLPKGSRVALVGKGTFDYVKGGGGSGDVTVPYVRNLYDGFLQHPEHVQVDEELAAYYRNYVEQQYAEGGIPGMIAEAKVPEELLKKAVATCDTAVVSISRFSGEAWDRKSELGGPGENVCDDQKLMDLQNHLFARSDFYLTPGEEELIRQTTEAFDRVVVVMNVGGMVASDWFAENDRIGSVLMAWQGGMEGGTAAAELLLGIGSPSGKLADTFARHLEDYPSTAGFHEAGDHVDYTEDIYVGYRYFETLPGAAEKVVYPFGYGLSYTSFSLEEPQAVLVKGEPDPAAETANGPDPDSGDAIVVTVSVTNTGDYVGREVVQLYAGAPQGLLGKPARVLVGYQKTRLLQPGETQRITIRVLARDLASYDDLGRVCKSAWVLEKGSYAFYLGTDVHSAAELSYHYEVSDNRITCRLVSRMAPTQLAMRLRADGTYENLPLGEPNDPNANGLERLPYEQMDGCTPEVRQRPHGYLSWTGKTNALPQLIDVAEGKLSLDEFIHALPDEDLAALLGGQVNTGVANTFGYGNLPDYGVPNIMTADGPAGLRIQPEVGVQTTAFPCSTLLACTWDPETTYAVGRAGGEEVKENNIGAWLTPAVNIHRSPLCGRNFEYYSEDPYLAGHQASGMVKGIQSVNVAATVKHFALNNKETNRKDSDSRVSERAIREIYLRQFEIIVKEAKPWSIMSSYNLINGHRASENRDMLKGVLRDEWGYDGMVTTDWWTYGEHYKECAAGNDMKMGCGFPDRVLDALGKGLITREQMELAARHILTLILRVD